MKHNNNGFWPWLILTIGLLTLSILFPFNAIKFTAFGMAIVTTLIVVTGIFIVPNDPPHFGIIEKWGKRLWKEDEDGKSVISYTEEGWNWVFLRGVMHKIKLINLSKREIDFPEQILTTPDGVTTKVPGSLAYTPNKSSVINLLNLGTNDPFKVFEDMIQDIVQEKLRIWSRRTDGGPMTWEELLNSNESAVKMLIEAISAKDIEASDLKKVQSGHGDWLIEKFGIIVNRLNLKEMIPFGEVYEEALKIKNEQQQGKAETYELKVDLEKAATFKEELAKSGITISMEKAIDQIMEWKIQREANTSLTIAAFAKSFAKAFKTN